MKTWGELFSALNNTEREVDVYTENWLNSYSELSSVYYSPSELNYYSLKLSNVFIKDREYDDEFKVGLGVSSVFYEF